jgi:hypothetical protein
MELRVLEALRNSWTSIRPRSGLCSFTKQPRPAMALTQVRRLYLRGLTDEVLHLLTEELTITETKGIRWKDQRWEAREMAKG